jgi:hypothetical protein
MIIYPYERRVFLKIVLQGFYGYFLLFIKLEDMTLFDNVLFILNTLTR